MNELEKPVQYLVNSEQFQIPLTEGLWAIAIISVVILVILERIGSAKFNDLKSTYVDPLADKVKRALGNSTSIQSSSWPEFQKNKQSGLSTLQSVEKEVMTHLKNTERAKPLAWNEFKLFTNKSRLSEVALYDARVESLNAHLESLKKEHEQLSGADLIVKHNHYYYSNSEYQSICKLTDDWETALSLHRTVLREIDEAQSAISSAQTAEMVDMFSKNKGVSLWSSMENSSAQSEINDIKPSIQRLVNHLSQLQKQEEMVVQRIEVSDTVDLVSDLFFDFSFDFTSIFSLMSLNSAESSVNRIESQIQPLGESIRQAVYKHQQVQSDFLGKLP